MKDRKLGEHQAIKILKSIGVEVDENYGDLNLGHSVPDLRSIDGRYIEVTHTKHNNEAYKFSNKYYTLRPGETCGDMVKRHYEINQKCSEAIDRIKSRNYPKDNDAKFTQEGIIQFNNDCKLVKSHLGYDYRELSFEKKYSEFNCDIPTFLYSTDNILREIVDDKGEKYKNGNVDLFVFAAQQEFDLLYKLLNPDAYSFTNAYAHFFLNNIHSSSFKNIYICCWDIVRQSYNTINPSIIHFLNNENVTWKYYNV